jgi:spermidine synthase
VVGCALSALLLFPFLGLQTSVTVAAALNGLVCIIAATAHFSNRREGGSDTPARTVSFSPAMPLSVPLSLALVLASGFVSLSFEIFFLHLAAFASGSNSTIFTMTLGAFLLGIASGADDAAQWSKSGEVNFTSGLCRLLLANGIAGLAVLPFVALSGPLGFGLIAVIALAAFIVARSLGAIFPLVSHLAIPPDGEAGSRAGLLYLINIIGSAAGSLLTGFVLCDVFGIRAQALILSGLGITLASLITLLFGNGKARSAVAMFLALAGLLALFQVPLTRSVVEAMLYKREVGQHTPLADVVENRYGIVAVSTDGTVYGGGVYDGRFNTDPVRDSNGIVRAYALSLFHPAPRDVFMIGLASGSWAQVVANNPEVRRLTIVEINPGYLPLVRKQAEVASLLRNPKVTIIIDDANRWLKRHPQERYDAIVANATYHFRSNAATLLSVEFNRMIASHLKRGGIYMDNTTESARVAVTGCDSFHYGYRFFNNMVLSNDPIRIDGARWRINLLATHIDGRPMIDLKRSADARALDHDMAIPAYANFVSNVPAAQPLESCANVIMRNTSHRPITDDNMGTEWRYPLGLD